MGGKPCQEGTQWFSKGVARLEKGGGGDDQLSSAKERENDPQDSILARSFSRGARSTKNRGRIEYKAQIKRGYLRKTRRRRGRSFGGQTKKIQQQTKTGERGGAGVGYREKRIWTVEGDSRGHGREERRFDAGKIAFQREKCFVSPR